MYYDISKSYKNFHWGGVTLISIALSLQSAQALSFSSASGTYNIPDANTTGVTVPITISGQPNISTFNSVTISGFTHTAYSDLRAFISNGTTTIQLFANEGSPDFQPYTNANLALNGTYTFAPTGNNWYTQITNPVPSGTYTSFQSLSGFNGASLNGTWTLNVQDPALSDTGSFTQWSFDVTPQADPVSVPEPSALLGLVAFGGIAAANGLRKRLSEK